MKQFTIIAVVFLEFMTVSSAKAETVSRCYQGVHLQYLGSTPSINRCKRYATHKGYTCYHLEASANIGQVKCYGGYY